MRLKYSTYYGSGQGSKKQKFKRAAPQLATITQKHPTALYSSGYRNQTRQANLSQQNRQNLPALRFESQSMVEHEIKKVIGSNEESGSTLWVARRENQTQLSHYQMGTGSVKQRQSTKIQSLQESPGQKRPLRESTDRKKPPADSLPSTRQAVDAQRMVPATTGGSIEFFQSDTEIKQDLPQLIQERQNGLRNFLQNSPLPQQPRGFKLTPGQIEPRQNRTELREGRFTQI